LAAAADDSAAAEPTSRWGSAAELKKEVCELLETLLDLHQRYGGGGTTAAAAAEQLRVVEAAEGALLPLLMASYGASCSPADAAAWSLAAAINRRQWERARRGDAAAAAEGAEHAALAALLHGPLSDSWCGPRAALRCAALRCAALCCFMLRSAP
jgi:hypothetical protein